MLRDLLKKLNEGIALGFGFFLVIGLLVGVYAFVEPSSGPGSSYTLDWSSPFLSKVNETNYKTDRMYKGAIDWSDCEVRNGVSLGSTTTLTCTSGYTIVDSSCSSVGHGTNSEFYRLNDCGHISPTQFRIAQTAPDTRMQAAGSIKCCRVLS